ncbi:MAG: BlaI/MecI/CopY family transcriptional regulator [Bryobacteraceae bacterium]|jgi:predicted transcriptional regulator
MRKPGPPPEIPPPLELECLKALWNLGEGNVRSVQQALAPARPLAYTTVMTVLDRLARKGAVGRRKSGRAFIYAPSISREALRRVAVRQLLESFFSGAEEELLAYLQGRPEAPAAGREHLLDASLDPALL